MHLEEHSALAGLVVFNQVDEPWNIIIIESLSEDILCVCYELLLGMHGFGNSLHPEGCNFRIKFLEEHEPKNLHNSRSESWESLDSFCIHVVSDFFGRDAIQDEVSCHVIEVLSFYYLKN